MVLNVKWNENGSQIRETLRGVSPMVWLWFAKQICTALGEQACHRPE